MDEELDELIPTVEEGYGNIDMDNETALTYDE